MEILIFLYLVIFAFGKLTGLMPDLIVFSICVLFLIEERNFGVNNFLLICFFSLVFSLSFFKLSQIFIGILYFARLVSYFVFSKVVYDKFGKNEKSRRLIFNSLIMVGVFVAIFGWFQYFVFPDLRALKTINWDDHYFRLVSTFLDPAFTGVVLILAEILVLVKTVQQKVNILNLLLNIFFVFTILFTYSRSSFLALFMVFFITFWKFKKKYIIYLILLFLIAIPFLPKASGGEGVKLNRTASVVDKFINYSESIKIIEKSPVFGIGFDNICIATNGDNSSHSCNGLDNSVLFIIATTGIVGFIIFCDFVWKIIKNTKMDFLGWALIFSLIVVFVHGMFTQTFFYNFVLGWMGILIGITRKNGGKIM